MSDRFVTPEPLPTEREREIMHVLIEEAAEVQQRATKLLRFGVFEVQPGQPHHNSERLAHEIGDFLEVLELAYREGLILPADVDIGRENKRRQLARFLQTEPHHD